MVELFDTTELMISKNYKDRFKAEYWQTKIRYERLKNFNNTIEASKRMDTEEPKHDCTFGILKEQQELMNQYLHVLEIRAIIENIDLTNLASEEMGNASK